MIVLLGFFFPWFSGNIGQEVGQMANEMTSAMNEAFQENGVLEGPGPVPRIMYIPGVFSRSGTLD